MIVVVMVLKLEMIPWLCCGHSDGSDGGCTMSAMAVVSDGPGDKLFALSLVIVSLDMVKL